jgi:hypothetical protein
MLRSTAPSLIHGLHQSTPDRAADLPLEICRNKDLFGQWWNAGDA